MKWFLLGWKACKRQTGLDAVGKFMANLASDNYTELGEGYRELKAGEKILPTDEYYNSDRSWVSRDDAWSRRALILTPEYKPGDHCVTRRKTESDQDFIAHLERASSIVAQWPEWKRNLLSDVCSHKSVVSYGGVVAAHRTPVTLANIIELLESKNIMSANVREWLDWLFRRDEMLKTLKMTKPI
jgi:hypothetical protein